MTMCMEAGPPLLDEMGRGSTKGQRNPTTSAVFILAASRYAQSNLVSFFFFRPFFFWGGYMPLFTAVETRLCFTWSASRVYGTLFKVASSPPPPDWLQEEKSLPLYVVPPEKTMVITNEAQPPQTITTTAGVNLKVLPRDGGLKWSGSMLTSNGSKLQDFILASLQMCLW